MESHVLCDTESAFFINFDLPGKYTSFQALYTLTQCLDPRRKHHITADNHFSNEEQLEKLQQRKLFATLNCKANTKPTLLWNGGLGRGLPKHRSRWAKKRRNSGGNFSLKF